MFWAEKKKGWYGKQLDENIKALKTGDRRCIPRIFCVFAEDHAFSKKTAAAALCSLLDSMQFDDIIKIDSQMRGTTSMEWAVDWRRMKIKDFFTAGMSKKERRAVVVFASFSPNGYIREQAVCMMPGYEGTLPYIILRRNDWVLQVRRAAAAAFYKRLQKPSAGEMLEALPFAEKLKGCGRTTHDEFIQSFFVAMCSPKHAEELSKGLGSGSAQTRRICVNALLALPDPACKKVMQHLKNEPNPFLRKVIFKKLENMGQDMAETAQTFLRDKYFANRLSALWYLYGIKGNDLLPVVQKLLLDRSAAVREASREILRKCAPEFDVSAFYLNHIESDAAVAILGLGEVGAKEKAAVIEKYLCDVRPAVVRAAMVSLMKLESERYSAAVTEMLGDTRSGVRKTARTLVVKCATANFERIREILHESPVEGVKVSCAAVLYTASKWQRLIYMLELLPYEMKSVRNLALTGINRWVFNFNKSFETANARQKEALLKLINAHKEQLGGPVAKNLLFFVK